MIVAIIAPGDMGAGVGAALKAGGHDIVTCLAGRSDETRARAARIGFRDLGDLDALVGEADIVLSILPPASALGLAREVAAAMARSGARPVYLDANAVSPQTAAEIGAVIENAGAPFIDGGIVGPAPGKGSQPTRLYVSGDDVASAKALAVDSLMVKPLEGGVGRASALKMLYAGVNKARFSLFALVATAAEALDLRDAFEEEMRYSQAETWAYMERMIPRLPADSERWAPELEEIGRTMQAAGLSGEMHFGAAWILSLMAATPLAAETRETFDASRTLADTLEVFVAQLRKDTG